MYRVSVEIPGGIPYGAEISVRYDDRVKGEGVYTSGTSLRFDLSNGRTLLEFPGFYLGSVPALLIPSEEYDQLPSDATATFTVTERQGTP